MNNLNLPLVLWAQFLGTVGSARPLAYLPLFFFTCYFETVSLNRAGSSRAHYETQSGLELLKSPVSTSRVYRSTEVCGTSNS